MFSDSPHRVSPQTSEEINCQIAEQIRNNVLLYGGRSADVIQRRLKKLDEEWDIERALEFNAAALGSTFVLFGLFGKKRWLLLAGTVTGFLAQHALNGWCPPLGLLRRLGFRTRHEIDRERYALKSLRGDFKDLEIQQESPLSQQTDAALAAVEA